MRKDWFHKWQDPKGAYCIPEEVWFKRNQKLLLAMAKTDFGRDLLEIPKEYPEIIYMDKHCLHCFIGGNQFLADFRTASKWANIIRTRFGQFQSYSRYFLNEDRGVCLSPLVKYARSVTGDVITYYPNPDPEVDSVDGFVAHDYVVNGPVWSTLRNASGTDSLDNEASSNFVVADSDGVTDHWNALWRGIFIFPTFSLEGATISSAILSLRGTFKNDSLSASPNVDIYTSSPASNTALVPADYTQIGVTSQTGSPITFANWSTTGYNDFTLDATGRGNVNIYGQVSKFGARNQNYDVANVSPPWVAFQSFAFACNMADQPGESRDPKLVVTYTPQEKIVFHPSPHSPYRSRTRFFSY